LVARTVTGTIGMVIKTFTFTDLLIYSTALSFAVSKFCVAISFTAGDLLGMNNVAWSGI
jgi:hypothetical protein